MIIQCADGTLYEPAEHLSDESDDKLTFYTEIPHHLLDGIDGWIDRLISFAFDRRDAQHVELRVVDPE